MRPHKAARTRRAGRNSGACTDSSIAGIRQPDEPERVTLQKVQEALWTCGGVHVMRNNAGSRRRKQPLEPGSSDLFAIVAPHGRWLCIETKRPKNKREEEHQEAWLRKMKTYGAVVAVVRSPEEVFALVEEARKVVSW